MSEMTTDNDYVKMSLNGHPQGYEQLVRRYQRPLLSYLSGRLGDLERAEEAAQESFVRAFFALRKLKKADSFFPWLFGIANRVAWEQQRNERQHREVIRLSPTKSVTPEFDDDQILRRAIAKLPRTYAEVILLRYYGELSCAQVAERLGVPLGTVTKRLSRAYRLLRDLLPEQCEVQP